LATSPTALAVVLRGMSAFQAFRTPGGFPQAVEVSGAGTEEVNGVYKSTDKTYCDAPSYEHVDNGTDLKITREPHTNPKTGATKHGWLLGLRKQPQYGVKTEDLVIPAAGWKAFGGAAPVPTIILHEQVVDVYFARADEAKTNGDAALEREAWSDAQQLFEQGLDNLKRSGERFGDPFRNRAALLLSRRGGANLKLEDPRAALRDAVAALELVRSLASAERTAVEAAQALGCTSDALAKRFLEPIGTGRVLDSGAPLVLRAVERWVDDLIPLFQEGNSEAALPEPRHLPADRYLPDMEEEKRQAILKYHIPGYELPPGGTGIVKDVPACLELMQRWEAVFNGSEFQQKRKDLWDRRDLNYVRRLEATREMVAESLSGILEPMGFAPGKPGLTRVVQQMQTYWSTDRAVANKALDLEELADISLADLASAI